MKSRFEKLLPNCVSSASKRGLSSSFLCLLALAGLLGCAQKNESQEDEILPGRPLVGVVLEVNEAEGTLKVAHEDIPDFMPAMTMDFRVSPEEMARAKPQAKIWARLVRDEDGGFRLVRIADEATVTSQTNKKLSRQVETLASGYYFGEGDSMPDFALVDQYGETVTPENYAGKAFMLNFIFTRCNDANMCPLSTSKMAGLQKAAQAKGIENLEFISITFDPEFDTPEVLKAYAEGYGIDGSNYRFVTGEMAVVKMLVKALGVTTINDGESFAHSLATVLVDKERKIVKYNSTSSWDPEEYLAAIEAL